MKAKKSPFPKVAKEGPKGKKKAKMPAMKSADPAGDAEEDSMDSKINFFKAKGLRGC